MTKESLQSSVIVNHNEGVTSLLLNQKNRLNALSADMIERLILGLEEAVSINANLVIFRGEGSSFSAGLDLSNIDKQSDADLLHRFVRIEQLLQIIYKLPISTLALVHGKCFGAAADIVSVCKHRIASPETSFRMPGLQFGIVLGTRRLAQLIGTDKANEFLETSRIFSADEGLKSQFLTGVNPADNWPEIINRLTKNASNLNSTSKASLLEAIRDDSQLDNDLATLVRSAIQPGLAKRIEKFIKNQVKK
jgi:enoyl-CoA hydratase/carnithine racemase